MDTYSKNMLKQFYAIHKNYILNINRLNNRKFKIRSPNFPEHISENIVKFIIRQRENEHQCYWNYSGDLINNNKKIECKCVTSNAPMSFGPTEQWDLLYILDAKNWIKDKFILYKINLSNTDMRWKNINISKNQTFYEQCVEKRRPRIKWMKLRPQLKNTCEIIFNGDINTIFE